MTRRRPVTGTVKAMGRYAAKVAGGVIPAATAARLGMPAVVAMALGAVLILAFACWVIGKQERTDRVSQILLARHGTLAAQPVSAVPPASTGTPKWMSRLVIGREKQKG